jgi:hypothetical protein
MASRSISRHDILRSTLFHIQVNSCQFIDDFPEVVASVFDDAVDRKGLKDYAEIKRKLYRIKTSFFKINAIKKKDFFEGLYKRLENKTR